MEKVYLPDRISSQRLVLRKLEASQAESMFTYVNEDRSRLQKFLPWVQFARSVEDELDYIQTTRAHWDQYELFDYAIFRTEDDLYLGNLGVHTIYWENSCCELGYWLLGKFEGQGYMREAVAVLTDICHDAGFNRVEIRCDPENKRSAGVPLGLGFNYEARLKENVSWGDGYRDTLIYSHLKSDGEMDDSARAE